MGILNLTPDSFYDGGRNNSTEKALQHVSLMVEQGVDILDIGAVSTRPGSVAPDTEEEWQRMADVLVTVRKKFPSLTISIDTYRSEIARRSVENGADIINDVTGGEMDGEMFETVASLGVSYVLTHIQNTPSDMQDKPIYNDVVRDVTDFFATRLQQLRKLGVHDVILDPGFGMGKTIDHNFKLLANLNEFAKFNLPLLAGVSHKSMLWKLLDTTPEKALNATTAANMLALVGGANILRVHEVQEAKECIKVFEQWCACK
ncbi:MAG: dihydropteroate synthase [Bacteroidales bacterium]|nr:dihydropteroate synthase [Bacteroidales bacterium]